MKYKYIVIQGDSDYYSAISEKSSNNNEAIFVSGLFDVKNELFKKVLNRLYRFFDSHKFHFFKRLLMPFVFHRRLPDCRVCFIVWSWYANDVKRFIEKKFRKKYPGCKIVCRFEDIIEKMPYKNIDDYRLSFDYLFSFDASDAKKHGIAYFPSWYDDCPDVSPSDKIDYDFLFIGRAKDRFNEISSLFEKLKSFGFRCFFYIVDVEKPLEKANGMVFGPYLSYKKVLSMVQRSSCLVELLQKDADSETLRVFEALFYNKIIISNNRSLAGKPYYDRNSFILYSDVNELKSNLLENKIGLRCSDVIKNTYRPNATFRYLDDVFNRLKN